MAGPGAEIRAEGKHWAVRLAGWLIRRLRPELGWIALICGILLALLPALAVEQASWVNLRRMGVNLLWLGPLGVAVGWLLHGLLRPLLRRSRSWRLLGRLLWSSGMALAGLVAVTEALLGWLPGPLRLWQAMRQDAWEPLGQALAERLLGLAQRVIWWWQGVQAGGAAQDNLVFLLWIGLLLWLAGALTAGLALGFRNGLALALPSLWLLSLLLYYGSQERALLLVALGLAIFVHAWLDGQAMLQRWQAQGVDYNPALLQDRLLAVAGAGLLLLGLAGVAPNVSLPALTRRAYQALAPYYQRTEQLGERLFPELERSPRGRGGGVMSGLPNSFLLGSGPELGEVQVMWVRSSLPGDPPPGFYMRGATLSEYDGQGWSNPADLDRLELRANQPWPLGSTTGRARLLQSVRLAFRSSILYGAGEPLEADVSVRAELRGPDDLVALWAPVKSYALVSAAPGVDEAFLARLPAWGEDLPPEMARHLQLPDTVTERTRELARSLTAGLSSPFAKAQAIEAYLRGYEYDLNVPLPPRDVDVTDYFLFDLQRGYCDYYSTAFVVLARLNGLPTRFATGYAVGQWDSEAREWVISEAEAHSWPEVYFPEVGWIPFEPTAGRPVLPRWAPEQAAPLPQAELPTAEEGASGFTWQWNGQMLFWLLPILGLVWLFWWMSGLWLARREDPWQALVRWGRRLGRPARPDETELEYATGLERHLDRRFERRRERLSSVVQGVQAISQAVIQARYAPAGRRAEALSRARHHWRRLRGQLWRLWLDRW